jgi:hypothetical protein
MMDNTDQCVRYFNHSSKRQYCLESTIKETATDEHGKQFKSTKLKELCRVRWVERHVAFDRFLELHECIVMALETISMSREEYNEKSVNEASTLLVAITKFEFIVSLVVTAKVLSYLKPLSTYLQTRTLDLGKAFDGIRLVRSSLQDVRNNVESHHSEWYNEAVQLAQKVNTEPSMPRIVTRQTLRSNNPAKTPEEHYRRNLTILLLDQVLVEMKTRFKDDHKKALTGMLLVPTKLLSAPQLPVRECQQYADDVPSIADLGAEIHMWQNFWKEKGTAEGDTLEKALQVATHMKETFPNVKAILQLMSVLPVTSCESERAFSQLKLLKTYLRSTMTEERLVGLALMKVHRSTAMSIEINKVIDIFARKHPRRMTLENIFRDSE